MAALDIDFGRPRSEELAVYRRPLDISFINMYLHIDFRYVNGDEMMRGRRVVSVTRWLIMIAIGVEAIVIAGLVLGPYGFGLNLPDLGGRLVWEGEAMMSAGGVLREPPAVDIDLSWITTNDGTVDASTGLPPVGLAGPFTARVAFWSPPAIEQALFVAARVTAPVLILVVLWLLFRLVTSVGQGTPFTSENGRRIWILALVIGVGGTAAGAFTQWVDSWLISRSAASTAFSNQGFVSLFPLLIGALLVVLAVAWGRGVALEEEADGLI